jgi:hypothetical protein
MIESSPPEISAWYVTLPIAVVSPFTGRGGEKLKRGNNDDIADEKHDSLVSKLNTESSTGQLLFLRWISFYCFDSNSEMFLGLFVY